MKDDDARDKRLSITPPRAKRAETEAEEQQAKDGN
jgi:hypothetical protein